MKNNIISIRFTESSPTEPVTSSEVKRHLHISHTDDDTEIGELITKCRKAIEHYCGISISLKTVTFTADLFHEWWLPYGPVIGISSVSTRSESEGSGPAVYETEAEGWFTDGDDFLTFNPNADNRYRIVYTAGMTTVPEDLKHAVLEEVLYRFKNKADYAPTGYNLYGQPIEAICPAAAAFAKNHIRLEWS